MSLVWGHCCAVARRQACTAQCMAWCPQMGLLRAVRDCSGSGGVAESRTARGCAILAGGRHELLGEVA